MVIDPELKAMSQVYDALESLDGNTQRRVIDWVLAKLSSGSTSRSVSTGAKRGPKPGSKRVGKKPGRKPGNEAATSQSSPTGAKRGPKPGSKRKGKRGRPPGSGNQTKLIPPTNKPKRRGRPSKK